MKITTVRLRNEKFEYKHDIYTSITLFTTRMVCDKCKILDCYDRNSLRPNIIAGRCGFDINHHKIGLSYFIKVI